MTERISPKELFYLCRELRETDRQTSHYLLNAFDRGMTNYRIFDNGTILKNKLSGRIPKNLEYLANESGEVIVIGNMYGNLPMNIVFRGITRKEFYVYGKSIPFYGLGMMEKNFTYMQPIILVEGLLDRDVLSQFYPNVLAVLSSSLTVQQREVLSILTKDVILAYDADEMGQRGITRDLYKLTNAGFNSVRVLKHPKDFKDAGNLAELRFSPLKDLYLIESIESYYRTHIDILVGGNIGWVKPKKKLPWKLSRGSTR
jgi:5S rRNA maturation endonuclease (ribonuclease M5)